MKRSLGLVILLACVAGCGCVKTEEESDSPPPQNPRTQSTADEYERDLERLRVENARIEEEKAREESRREDREIAEAQAAFRDDMVKYWARTLAKRQDAVLRKRHEQSQTEKSAGLPVKPYQSQERQLYNEYLAKLQRELENANDLELFKKAQELNVHYCKDHAGGHSHKEE